GYVCDTFSLVLNLSGYNKSASCAPRNGPFHPWSPRNRSLRVSLWRSCARLQHHPSPSSLYKIPLADSSHSIDLCSPFARLDRRRSGSCRKMAPILSSHSPASCLPVSRQSPRSPLWPRLTRLPPWSRRQPRPHCSRSKSPPAFSRVLVRRPDRSASSAPLAPRCSTLWSHRRRLPRLLRPAVEPGLWPPPLSAPARRLFSSWSFSHFLPWFHSCLLPGHSSCARPGEIGMRAPRQESREQARGPRSLVSHERASQGISTPTGRRR